MITFNVNQFSNRNRRILKRGDYTITSRLANGTLRCGQIASYSQSESYSKNWSLGIDVSGVVGSFGSSLLNAVKDITFGASASIGESFNSGSSTGTSLPMAREYARPIVYAEKWDRNIGYWTGKVTYDLQRKRKTGLRRTWRTYAKVESTFNNYARDNEFDGEQPFSQLNNGKTFITFGWEEFGDIIPNCNARQDLASVTLEDWWN